MPTQTASNPWSVSDMFRKWHPLDALLAERRAILKGESDSIQEYKKKDFAWWRELSRS